MGYEVPGFKPGTLVAAADLSTHQFKFVKMTSTGINIATAATDHVIGVLQNKPAAGEACEIDCDGISKVKAAAAIAVGAAVAPDAAGKATTHTPAGTGVGHGSGIALEAATADGDVIAVKIQYVT